jgi:hypothetical protein
MQSTRQVGDRTRDELLGRSGGLGIDRSPRPGVEAGVLVGFDRAGYRAPRTHVLACADVGRVGFEPTT